MKLTKSLLIKLINEAMEHGGLSCNEVHPEHTHDEWETHKKEEDEKIKAMAKISIKPSIIVENEGEDSILKDDLRDILKKWQTTEYDSDEDRWREYGKDIQELVGDELKEG
jgi:hypothetical protein